MLALLGVCTAGAAVPAVRVETLQRVVYAADDAAVPRWRFLAVPISQGPAAAGCAATWCRGSGTW